MHRYWKVEYTSCEGNYRLTTVKTPDDFQDSDVEHAMLQYASMGDDPAEILSVTEVGEGDYTHEEEYT